MVDRLCVPPARQPRSLEPNRQLSHAAEECKRGARALGSMALRAFDRALNERYLTARDGFLAFGAGGEIYRGQDPSAQGYSVPRISPSLRPFVDLLARRTRAETLVFEFEGSKELAGPGARRGEGCLPLDQHLGRKALAQSGSLCQLKVHVPQSSTHASVPPARLGIMKLPRDYLGPILLVDIDETLRETQLFGLLTGHWQKTVPGAQELLQGAADLQVPIVYLSAGGSVIRPQNRRFLERFPEGILLDDPDFRVGPEDLSNQRSTFKQARYKSGMIEKLRETYPKAQLFGLGDDRYGDAIAYDRGQVRAFIHDVQPNHRNLPPNFEGVLSPTYDDGFRRQVLGELKAAVDSAQRGDPGRRSPIPVT